MDATYWDEMYRSRERVFSGHPNPVLVAEAAELPPVGKALDVGCGEGADALWLAGRGWQVTAADVSGVALQRAATAATGSEDLITWECADLIATPPPAGFFDLVSLQYFPLRRQPDHTALHGLLNAVAPGGTLLFATHALADMAPHGEFDPADYYQPDEIAQLLDSAWDVVVNETRPRVTPTPRGTRHTHDAVLRARRLS